MPGRDGTGPIGTGEMTGRGLGACNMAKAVNYGAGFGLYCRRGLGRGFGRLATVGQTAKTQKELLQKQKTLLQNKIEIINNQLENL